MSKAKKIVCGCLLVVLAVALLYVMFSRMEYWLNPDEDAGKVPRSIRVSERPKDFSPLDGEVREYQCENTIGVGSDKFMVLSDIEQSRYSLCAFSKDSSICDLCWLATRMYNEILSPQLQQGTPLSESEIARIELCIQIHLAYVHSAMAQFLMGLRGDSLEVKKTAKSYYLHCFTDSQYWQQPTLDMINTLCLHWYETENGKRAKRIGEKFAKCDQTWLGEMIPEILNESNMDIRWPNLVKDERGWWDRTFGESPRRLVEFDFDGAYELSMDWKEIQTIVYFESVRCLTRMNREITVALSRVSDVQGYQELHQLIEMWRPRMKAIVRLYSLAYSDLPLVILGKAAYDQTKVCDKVFSTDRPKVKEIAAQYTRATSDGSIHRFAGSATSGSIVSQYHGYLKKLLGADDYQTFSNSIKWRKADPLKDEE